MKYLIPLLITFLMISNLILGQSKAEKAEQLLNHHHQNNEFEGAVLIAENGKVIYKDVRGLADRTTQTPLTTTTRFGIASITKSFTAVLIFQLIEEGKIKLDDPVTKYLTDIDIKGLEKVQIGHLLINSTGLGVEPAIGYLTVQSPLEMLKKYATKKIKGNPGTNHNYSNLDYMALGLIIEKVTDKSWSNALEERILEPLNMTNTGILYKKSLPPNLAKTYKKVGEAYKVDKPFFIENIYAAGAMYSTLDDLYKYDRAMYNHQLLTAKTQNLMNTSFPEMSYVSYGNWTYHFPFVKSYPLTIERRGGIQGFNGVIMRFPEANKCLIILSNNGQFNPDKWGDNSNIKQQLVKVLFDEDIENVEK